jgi:ABC-2 type transport system permease protein
VTSGRRRFRALLSKELLDVVRNRTALLPVTVTGLISLMLPIVIVVVIPAMTGQGLAGDADLSRVSQAASRNPMLGLEARVQLFLFQQFLMLFLLTPVTGAMALAAHAVVGEKQARTLEPLLATPITTAELLLAKVFGALVPTVVVSLIGLSLYAGIIGFFAEPGVLRAMLNLRAVVLVLIVGPASALVTLQAALVISSRVNDARTAQQFGVLIILPLTGLVVAQFVGAIWLSASALAAIGAGLIALWIVMVWVSVAVFDREAILTRWR